MKDGLRDIPLWFLRECFELRESGELFWKARPAYHFPTNRLAAAWVKAWAGKQAGSYKKNGYCLVTVVYEGRTRKVLAHRIVWALTHGEWPKLYIDHINRNPSDNRIENLRDVTHAENMANKAPTKRSSLLGVGVYLSRSRRFRTQISVKGKVRHLGTFDSFEEAQQAFTSASAIARATA